VPRFSAHTSLQGIKPHPPSIHFCIIFHSLHSLIYLSTLPKLRIGFSLLFKHHTEAARAMPSPVLFASSSTRPVTALSFFVALSHTSIPTQKSLCPRTVFWESSARASAARAWRGQGMRSVSASRRCGIIQNSSSPCRWF